MKNFNDFDAIKNKIQKEAELAAAKVNIDISLVGDVNEEDFAIAEFAAKDDVFGLVVTRMDARDAETNLRKQLIPLFFSDSEKRLQVISRI